MQSIVGSPETVRTGLRNFLKATEADELMVVSAIYDPAARLQSYEILADVARELPVDVPRTM
jgi:alkanesulfonate monooxygenase SsuD/methylene tetrahydromethanopterin reductase-like flavin-dependent oxidoreductase (luciferase family)